MGEGCGAPGPVLTQTKMEKKAKLMAALAPVLPTRSSLGEEWCHWLARKQKPTNQVIAQSTAREKRLGEPCRLAAEECRPDWGLLALPLVPPCPVAPPHKVNPSKKSFIPNMRATGHFLDNNNLGSQTSGQV